MLTTIVCTALALLAFAANSLLCRLALATTRIDPASFTALRLATGAAVLGILVRLRSPRPPVAAGSWSSAALLALYAAPFAFAYRHLTTGTSALLLFAAVQITMILGGIRAGRPPSPRQWLGLTVAMGGLTYLVLPGLAAPSPLGTGLMLLAGLAWGLYSLAGRTTTDPLAHSAQNFARALPWALGLLLFTLPATSINPRGALLAVASGGLASGLGYVLWYLALPQLSPVLASLLQLAVPPLAAGGGVLLLGEPLTARLVVASLLILGGIAIGLRRRSRASAT